MATVTTRSEHIAWCKQRAHDILKYDDSEEGIRNAFGSMASDLDKHPETKGHADIGLGMIMLVGGKLSTKDKMAEFIDSFR